MAEKTLLPFRVHYDDTECPHIDVTATDSVAAKKMALEKHKGIIRKIKIIRER